jgi:D-galactarolactone cycloisomerase
MREGKIDKIELHHVELPLPTALFPVWIPGYAEYWQCFTLLTVTTRDGLVGHATGPAFHRERAGLGELIGQFLLGLDPYDPDLARERLRQASFLGWRNSWIDVAFWDLAGKARGVPVHQLLAERLAPAPAAAPESLRVYASFRELRPHRARAETLERARRVGFRGAKIPLHAAEESEDGLQLAEARRAAGPDFELMAHAHQAWSVSLVEQVPRWDLARATRTAERAAELGFAWVQEPLHDEAWDDLAALAASAPLPIAGGDLIFDPTDLRTRTRDRCYSILTPDASFAGLGTALRTMEVCRAKGLGFSPSANGAGLGLVANAHALAAWARACGDPLAARLEYPWEPPAMIAEHRDLLLEQPLHLREDGTIALPQGPGLGVDLDLTTLRRYGRRFFTLTPVRFLVNSARRSGLKQTAEHAQPRGRKVRRAARVE